MENTSTYYSASLTVNASQKRNAATQRGKGNTGLPVSLIQWQLLNPWSMITDKDN